MTGVGAGAPLLSSVARVIGSVAVLPLVMGVRAAVVGVGDEGEPAGGGGGDEHVGAGPWREDETVAADRRGQVGAVLGGLGERVPVQAQATGHGRRRC